MKMKADLNETRNKEKQMWNAVNEKRDVREKKSFKHRFDFFAIEIETTTKGKQRTSSGKRA